MAKVFSFGNVNRQMVSRQNENRKNIPPAVHNHADTNLLTQNTLAIYGDPRQLQGPLSQNRPDRLFIKITFFRCAFIQ